MLSGAETTASNNLIQGTYFINSIPLVTIIDTGATHSFISAECVLRLNFKVSANDSVTTLLVCLNFPLTIYGRDFGIDLVCLPLSQLNVILGMN